MFLGSLTISNMSLLRPHVSFRLTLFVPRLSVSETFFISFYFFLFLFLFTLPFSFSFSGGRILCGLPTYHVPT